MTLENDYRGGLTSGIFQNIQKFHDDAQMPKCPRGHFIFTQNFAQMPKCPNFPSKNLNAIVMMKVRLYEICSKLWITRCGLHTVLHAPRSSKCAQRIAPNAVCSRRCAPGAALQTLRSRRCVPSAALQALSSRRCAPGSALQVLRSRRCAPGAAL